MKDKFRPPKIHTDKDTPYVAIIGAGPAGLVAAVWALRHGLIPVIFEKNDGLGGLWNPKHGSTWDSMRTNFSKFTCMFSDLPWEDDTNMFPSQQDMYHYLCRYAAMFNLRTYMRLNTTVQEIHFDEKSYTLIISDINGRITCVQFPHVIVASGFFSEAYVPNILNMKMFTDNCKKVIHSTEYKKLPPVSLAKKHVAIIGNGFSSAEIAVDLANHDANVIHVVDKLHWILPRYVRDPKTQSSMPIDLKLYNRAARATTDEITIKDKNANQTTNKYLSGFCPLQSSPNHPLHIDPNNTDPEYVSVADGYMACIHAKKIKAMLGNLLRFTEDGFILDTGNSAAKIDIVIFCTGFKTKLSFPIMHKQNTHVLDLRFSANDHLQPFILYKGVLPASTPNMAFVGMYRGPYFATMELQARWACMLFANEIASPTAAEMKIGIDAENKIRQARPRPQFPHGDYVGYSDALAKEIGCLPDFSALKTSDPKLYEKLWAAPAIPTHYRIVGPHADLSLFNKQHQQIQKTLQAVPIHAPFTPILQFMPRRSWPLDTPNDISDQKKLLRKKTQFKMV